MRAIAKVLSILILLTGLFSICLAQTYPPYPIMQPPTIQPTVTVDPDTMLFTYTYQITNSPQSTARIWEFTLDASRNRGTLTPRVDQWNNPKIEPMQNYKNAINEIGNKIIPVALQVAPRGWLGSTSFRGEKNLFGFKVTDYILPGQTQGPFVMVSYGMVGVRSFSVEDPIDVGDLPDPEEALPNYDRFKQIVQENLEILKKAEFQGQTLGPIGPPVNCNVACLVGFLSHQTAGAFKLGWIDDPGVANALSAKLNEAKSRLEAAESHTVTSYTRSFLAKVKLMAGDKQTAINILRSFLLDLDAQHKQNAQDTSRHITDNAYYLLKPNTQYILTKLGVTSFP